jgi:hypothetical protein
MGLSATGFPEQAYDWLIEIADELTGFCHPSRGVRFPGDPVDEDGFVSLVRGNRWLKPE